eukprot:4203543-Amphidinium_carterae.1
MTWDKIFLSASATVTAACSRQAHTNLRPTVHTCPPLNKSCLVSTLQSEELVSSATCCTRGRA